MFILDQSENTNVSFNNLAELKLNEKQFPLFLCHFYLYQKIYSVLGDKTECNANLSKSDFIEISHDLFEVDLGLTDDKLMKVYDFILETGGTFGRFVSYLSDIIFSEKVQISSPGEKSVIIICIIPILALNYSKFSIEI